MMEIGELIRNGEVKNIEFKESLSKKIHLDKLRRQGLASQMKYRVLNGGGKAIYLLGVADDGEIKGLSEAELKEAIGVLNLISKDIGYGILDKQILKYNGKFISKVEIGSIRPKKEHLLIATAGHVDHGKSTLVGSLVSGQLDDGNGKTRLYLDLQKHEIERGLSADLSYAVYGFDSKGKVMKLKNPNSKKEKADVVKRARKIVSFVDTVGHEPWLRTTIRGIVGQKLDYGILTISSDDGITHITREHLGILLAMDLQVIIAITKLDKAGAIHELKDRLVDLLNIVGKVPKFIKGEEDLLNLNNFWENKAIVPVVMTSAKSGEGLELMDKLLYRLPKRATQLDRNKDFLMYIDKVYKVSGVGTVVSGSVNEGVVRRGVDLYMGPDTNGNFDIVRASSIEIHHFSVDTAEVGEIIGIAIKSMNIRPKRGMIITSSNRLKASTEFEADVVILNHPTRVSKGYEPVLHLETISETVVVEPLSKEYLTAGERGRVRMRFKYFPYYYIREGQKFVFREGKSKGIGTVTKIRG